MKRNYFLLAGLITLAAVGGSFVFYSRLPAIVPAHWNIRGEVDRYGSKWETLAFMPAIMVGMILLVAALPWLSPRKYEMNGGKPAYLQIMTVLLVFFAYIHFTLLSTAAGRHFDVPKAVLGGVCALFAAMGPMLSRLPRNFYVGVRTPWTLANEHVWQATHHFAAKCFTAGGLVGLVLTFTGLRVWALVVASGVAAVAPVIYSLVIYKQLERRNAA